MQSKSRDASAQSDTGCFLQITDLLLHFSDGLFVLALVFEIRVVGGVPELLFNLPLYFVYSAFGFVFGAFVHGNLLWRYIRHTRDAARRCIPNLPNVPWERRRHSGE